MLSNDQIRRQIKHSLARTNFTTLGERYEGKVRDCYVKGGTRFLITTDRLSCFDKVVAIVPFKGQVLTQLAVDWFAKVEDIVLNHLIDVPDPNVMIVKDCEIVPIEVVMRGYLAGSAWRDYQRSGEVSGISLTKDLREFAKLPENILTPSTKAPQGQHDLPISEAQILQDRIVPESLWIEIKECAEALFARGQSEAAARGLILVDTKYEFGVYRGQLMLADEIHTLDSSRYWVAESYEAKLAQGEAPEMLDKEPTRQWLLSQGFRGDGPVPEFTEDHIVSLARHYIDSYEQITGKVFVGEVGEVSARIAAAVGG